MTEDGPVLVFVYNADSGLFNAVTDTAHKLLSPGTYQCQLCALTHGPLRMHREWAEFLEGLGVTCEFRHRDEIGNEPGMPTVALPAVLYRTASGLEPCLDAEEIRACPDLDTLKGLIAERCLGSR